MIGLGSGVGVRILAQALTPLVGQRWPELKAVIETDFKEMFEAESNEFRLG